jgi:aerobic-type carbon monoxide dehydrogenase small subunit (CoxS/CutS family)
VTDPLSLVVDGRPVEVPDDGSSLLDVLRERLGLTVVKDGCSPQGQCGCCTVLVDGAPRVACVTPARRVRGRSITTLDGLDPDDRRAWGEAFCAAGASQCGFCTPGIVVRLAGLAGRGVAAGDHAAVEQALLAHLCRCTGWRTIIDAWTARLGDPAGRPPPRRDLAAAGERATIEGRSPQAVAPEVALGHGGFADDEAPADALVAVPDGAGGWAVAETLAAARAAAAKVQGRRTTAEVRHPLEVPAGDWAATLRTTWVDPGYLELDASWCAPGGRPATPLANGGAFGGKRTSPAAEVARRLAGEHGRPVRVVLAREDAVRLGPKRPPVAGGMAADGTGVLRVAATPGISAVVAAVAPDLAVELVPVAGPPTAIDLRAAGWAEAVALAAAAGPGAWAPPDRPGVVDAEVTGDHAACVVVRSPEGAVARAEVDLGAAPRIAVRVTCGRPLDEVVLRSYCVGAAHMGLGWVCSEGLAVDEAGEVHDLTIRSLGILRAVDTPPVAVAIDPSGDDPVNGSDAVFAAVAAAAWLAQGAPPAWPTGHRPRGRR